MCEACWLNLPDVDAVQSIPATDWRRHQFLCGKVTDYNRANIIVILVIIDLMSLRQRNELLEVDINLSYHTHLYTHQLTLTPHTHSRTRPSGKPCLREWAKATPLLTRSNFLHHCLSCTRFRPRESCLSSTWERFWRQSIQNYSSKLSDHQ